MKMRRTAIMAAILSSAMLMTACGTDESSSDSAAATTSAAKTSSAIEVVTTTGEEETTEEKTTEEKTTEANAAEETTEAETTEEATEDETEEGTEQAPEMKNDSSYDYTDLSGFWYVDGDTAAASIHILPNGRFESYYASGNLENSGYISREKSDESIGWVFVFCNDSDQPIMSFREIDLLGCAEFVISETNMHFIKLFGEGGLGDDGRAPEEKYLGTWQCDRATITIAGDTVYPFIASIVWGDGANSHYTWEYPCELNDAGQLVCDGKGQKVHIWKLDDTDAAPDFKILYSDGSAVFDINGNGLYWTDLNENRGAGMVFTYLPEE